MLPHARALDEQRSRNGTGRPKGGPVRLGVNGSDLGREVDVVAPARTCSRSVASWWSS